MTGRTTLGATAMAAALLAGNAAVADVTAQQVWDMWKENIDVYGEGALTHGTEQVSGGVLTVPGLAIRSSSPESTVEADLGDLVLTENGDGTVTVTMAEEIEMVFSPGPEITEADRATVVLRPGDLSVLVSGTEAEMVFEVAAPRYEMELTEVISEGAPMQAEASLVLNDGTGTVTVREGDPRELDYDLALGSIDLLVDATPPEGEQGTFFLSGQVADLALDASVAVPADLDMNAPPEEMAMVFENGLAFSGGYSFGRSTYMFNFDDGTDTLEGTVTAASGEQTGSFSSERMSYDTQVSELALNLSGSQLPFPVEVAADEYGLGLDVPLSTTEEPVPFGASLSIVDLAVNDMVWSMIDPSGQLPHDPLTATIALNGTGRLFYDVLDPESAEAMAEAPVPGELYSLDLSELNIAAGGAGLTGGGSFTFDNTDMETFPGMPRPTGQLTLQLTGGNTLLDTLVAMGLVPEEAAMQSRMMMGMFARVTGEDQLETTVEVNDEGHLIVNGQRLQ